MTTTCLPSEAYYHINRNTPKGGLKVQPPQDRQLQLALEEEGIRVARPTEWLAAYERATGHEFYEEYPRWIWEGGRIPFDGESVRVMTAFAAADRFVATVMHRLFPFQYREMVVALTNAIVSYCDRRHQPTYYQIDEEEAKRLLDWAAYTHMVEWLEKQQ